VCRPGIKALSPSERGAAVTRAALVAIRLVQERQRLPLALLLAVAAV